MSALVKSRSGLRATILRMNIPKQPSLEKHDHIRTLPEYDVTRLLGPFLKSVKPNGKILDLGAGSGLQAKEAVRHELRVVAVDVLDRPLGVEAKEIEWITCSLEAYIDSLTPDQLFEGALLQSIIHFFSKEYVLETLLPAVMAHAKPGACIAIETMSVPPNPPLKKFQSFYAPEELTGLMQGEVLLSEQQDTQRLEEDGSFRTFHYTRVIVRI